MRDPVIVLKFGGSVLRDESAVRTAADEAARFVNDGWRVVAVVSALEGTTDRLLAQSRGYGDRPHAPSVALLLATGELTSAALLGLALAQRRLTVETLDAASIGLRTTDDPLDASPLSLDEPTTLGALARASVIVVPGFVGRDATGRTTLLGRGGSDLTALFVADRLGAACRLVKDVDGLYEWDPAAPGPRPRRYSTLPWEQALRLDGTIVQHKAVRWAQQHGLSFEVSCIGGRSASRVGPWDVEFDGEAPGSGAPRPERETRTEREESACCAKV
ncbi:MAG: hypothetical protein KJZ54_01020 [Phycisphaerales bacterium]|nr:hypothetical protein [Phycisphaerales bacterium]